MKEWQTACGRQARQTSSSNGRQLTFVCKSLPVKPGTAPNTRWPCTFSISINYNKKLGLWHIGNACQPNHNNACLQQAAATASSLRGLVGKLVGSGDSVRPKQLQGLLENVHNVRATRKEVHRALALVQQQTRAAFDADVQLLPSTVTAINAQVIAEPNHLNLEQPVMR